jgi:DNA-directed RNA polymerase sigma subunit (sigma70/sigma32)
MQIEHPGERSLRLVPEAPRRHETDWLEIDSLDRLLSAIGRYPLLSPPEQLRLARRVAAGDEAARTALIESHLRLVVATAARRRGHELPFLDVIQEGALGLIRAVDSFDPGQGTPFTAYARWWIELAISRAAAAGAEAELALTAVEPAGGDRPDADL